MFIVLYRWRVKPEREKEFIDAWSEITALYRNRFGSLGSRLHRADDGLFYGYAQWQSAEHRKSAFQEKLPSTAAVRMQEAIEESFPEILLETLADFLILPDASKMN